MRPSSFSCRTRRLNGGTSASTCGASTRETMPGWSAISLQVACRPGRRARGVDLGQLRDDSLELGVLRQAFSKGDARIVAGETELDAQERALAGDRRPQLVG